MKRILYTADIHVHPRHIERLVQEALKHQADALIIGGDIIPHNPPRGRASGIIDAQAEYLQGIFIPTLKNLISRRKIPIYLDMGNDDLAAGRPILENYQGRLLHLLHMQKHALTDAVDVIGYMNVPPTPFQRKDWEKPDTRSVPYAPAGRIRVDGYTTWQGRVEKTTVDLNSDNTIEKDLNRLSLQIHKPFIFVAHCPPHGTPLDQLADGSHAGSVAVRDFIEHWSSQGLLIASLHGHIHESPTVSGRQYTRIHQTLCVNTGQRQAFQYVMLGLTQEEGRYRIEIFPDSPGIGDDSG